MPRQRRGSSVEVPLDADSLQTKTVPVLRLLCDQRKLSPTGRKQQLIDRLVEHDLRLSAPPSESSASNSTSPPSAPSADSVLDLTSVVRQLSDL